MTTFKVGDRVIVREDRRRNCGALGRKSFAYLVLTGFHDADGWVYNAFNSAGEMIGDCCYCYTEHDMLLCNVEAAAPREVNFILQYELDKDPFETFSTMAAVKNRIRELAARSDLKRDSIKVYTVASVQTVKLDVAISFAKPVKAADEPKKARKPYTKRRKRHARYATEAERAAAKRAYMKAYYLKRKRAA